MFNIRRLTTAGALALAVSGNPVPAIAYPIDCAILLCLAGGFPASAECTAAKATMIRRITPWPIEPPLQLWNCPMSIPADLAAQIGLTNAGLGRDGLPPDVRAYRDAVEIYHIRTYRRWRNSDGDEMVTDITERGHYKEDGTFQWLRASYEAGPAWLAEAAGGARVPIRTCVREHRENGCQKWEITGYTNGGGTSWSGLRGVAIRTKDYAGNYQTEWVPY